MPTDEQDSAATVRPPDQTRSGGGRTVVASVEHHPSRGEMLAAVVGALFAGVCIAVQSRANGELTTHVGSGLVAACLSFAIGLTLLLTTLLVPAVRRAWGRMMAGVRSGRPPRIAMGAGLIGAAFVISQASIVPVSGVAVFVVSVVAGQTTFSLLVDRLGLSPAGSVPVTVPRAAASALGLVGVAITVLAGSSASASSFLGPALIAVAMGGLMTVQHAANGRLSVAAGSGAPPTLLNFVVGGLGLATAATVMGVSGRIGPPESLTGPWWMWLGGPLGLTFIFTSAVVIRHLGVLMTTLLMLTGQITTAVLLDLANAAAREHIGPLVLTGVGVTFLGAALGGIAARRAAKAAKTAAARPTAD